MNGDINTVNAVNLRRTSKRKMNSDDSDEITIVGDAFSTNNVRIVRSEADASRPADAAVNSLPYKCKLCGNIYQTLESVKYHYEKVHIRHKAVMCKLESDDAYDNDDAAGSSLSECSDEEEKEEDGDENMSSRESVDGSTASVCPPPENFSHSSPSTSEASSSSEPKAKQSTHTDDHGYAMKLKCAKRGKGGKVKKLIKSQSPNKIQTPSKPNNKNNKLHIFNRVVPSVRNVTKVAEVKQKELVPLPKVCDWFTNCYPLRDPYYPQIDDQVLVFVSAYKKYEECVTKDSSLLTKQDMIPEISRAYQISGVVRDIEFKFRNMDGTKYVILITVDSERGQVKLWWCSYPRPDYIVLSVYNNSGDWLVGDRFRTIANQAWWLGTITKYAPHNSQSLFHCFEVKFDTGDNEYLSPWDLYKENTSRRPKKQNAGVPLYTDELPLLEYAPQPKEWPVVGRPHECQRILKAIRKILTLNVGVIFRDLHSSAHRLSSIHDVDLHVMVRRLESTFYRRIKAVLFDLKLVKQTVEVSDFDCSSKERAILALEALEQFISNPECNDILQFTSKSLPLSDPVNPPQKVGNNLNQSQRLKQRSMSESSSSQSSQNVENTEYACIWRDDCLKLLEDVCKEPFAQPFIEPVSLDDFPDYRNFIKEPMDLKTITARLESTHYSTPEGVEKDIRLMIRNSRCYNVSTKTAIYHFTTQLENALQAGITKIIHEYLATERLQKRARRKLT